MKTTFTETTYNKFQLTTKDKSKYIEYCKDEYHKNLKVTIPEWVPISPFQNGRFFDKFEMGLGWNGSKEWKTNTINIGFCTLFTLVIVKALFKNIMSFVTVQQTKAALKLLSKNTAERLKVKRKGDIVCYALIIFAFFFWTWN